MDVTEMADGDRYLLTSDGLDKHLLQQEIAQTLASGAPDEAAQRLIDMTLARGAADNVSVAVIDVHRSPATAAH
jgi:serine/threonine protein phosphatase PrpC